jgi:hypothetical protein
MKRPPHPFLMRDLPAAGLDEQNPCSTASGESGVACRRSHRKSVCLVGGLCLASVVTYCMSRHSVDGRRRGSAI